MNRDVFRVALFDRSTSTDVIFMTLGTYAPAATPPTTNYLEDLFPLLSLNEALSVATSFQNRFQSKGKPTRAEIYKKVVDYTANGEAPAPSDPIRALTADNSKEQLVAALEPEVRGEKQRIRLSNMSASKVAGASGLDPEYLLDPEGNAANGADQTGN